MRLIEVRRLPSPLAALGAAAHFVAGRRPFAEFKAGPLVGTLHGQVRRGHYLMAFEAQRLRAYLGWALLDRPVAERLLRTGQPPAPEEAEHGQDVVWLLTVAALDAPAMRACLDAARADYAGMRVMGVRHRADGRVVVVDRAIRRRG